MRNCKIIAVIACALCLLCIMTACTATPAPPASTKPAQTEEPGAEPLLLAAENVDGWLKDIVDAYNATGPEREVELVKCGDLTTFVNSLEDGGSADMYFVELDGSYGESSNGLWEHSADLSGYLDGSGAELVPGLRGALEYGGELRYLPFDFTLFTFFAQLSELPASMPEAAAAAESSGTPLFTGYYDRANLRQLLTPFLAAGYEDEELRQQLDDAIEAHPEEGDPEVEDGLFWLAFIRNDTDFAQGAREHEYENDGTEYVYGLPGASTAAFFVPHFAFGIFEGCSDPDAAWDFLKLLYSDENQARAPEFPASADAFDSYMEDMVSSGAASEHIAEKVREVVDNTNAATGLQLYPRVLDMAA